MLQEQQKQQQEQQRSLESCLRKLLQNNQQDSIASTQIQTNDNAANLVPPNNADQGRTVLPTSNTNNQLLGTTDPPVHFTINPVTSSAANLNPTFGFDSQQLLSNQGTSFNMKNPYLPPPIPAQCLTKIKNMDYVDFGSLLASILPNSLNMAMILEGEDDEEFCLSQIQTPGAAATFRKKSRRNAIANFPTWVMAWNVFYEATLHFHPDKHHELFSYFKHISEYAVSHKFKFLAAYDKAHRIHIAAQKDLPPIVQTSSWTRHCPSMYNLYLKDKMTAQCNNCMGWGHYENQCPKNAASVMSSPLLQPQSLQVSGQFRNALQQEVANTGSLANMAPNNKSANKATCFRYNKEDSTCQQSRCTYPHICKWCFQKGLRRNHPAYLCPNPPPPPNTTTTVFRPGH